MESYKIAELTDLRPGEAKSATLDGTSVALFILEGGYYAPTSNDASIAWNNAPRWARGGEDPS